MSDFRAGKFPLAASYLLFSQVLYAWNGLTIGIMVLVAGAEREASSRRTKEATIVDLRYRAFASNRLDFDITCASPSDSDQRKNPA